MKKKVSTVFGEKIFFLGQDENNINHWLVEATWDCGWNWEFGHIQTYSNNAKPKLSKRVSSYRSYDGMIFGNNKDHINGILKTPLTNSESWELSDLMKSFYMFKKIARVFYQGNSHMTSTKKIELNELNEISDNDFRRYVNMITTPKFSQKTYEFSDNGRYCYTNEVRIPQIIQRIYKMLTPEDEAVLIAKIPVIKEG